MKEELSLLKDSELLKKINRLLDLLFQEKYGLYFHDYTGDLTQQFLNKNFSSEKSVWDDK